jgi:hypothetical protein
MPESDASSFTENNAFQNLWRRHDVCNGLCAKEDVMFQQTKQAHSTRREAKFYVVPALIIAGWLTVAGGVIASLSLPTSLTNSIATVLRPHTAAQPSTAVALAQAEENKKH